MQTPASNIKICRVIITLYWNVCFCCKALSTNLFTHVDVYVRCTDARVRSKRQIRSSHQLRKPWKFDKLLVKRLFYAEFAVWVT
jgi:hypothetical protein